MTGMNADRSRRRCRSKRPCCHPGRSEGSGLEASRASRRHKPRPLRCAQGRAARRRSLRVTTGATDPRPSALAVRVHPRPACAGPLRTAGCEGKCKALPRTRHRHVIRTRCPSLAFALAAATSMLGAQQTPALAGYTAAASARQRQLEADAARRPSAASAERHSRALSAEPHVAGTAAQARTRDYVINEMKRLGLQTEVRAYDVYMPHATAVRVWRVAPDSLELRLAESPVAGDSTSSRPQYPTVNGSSGSGDVAGDVVYVNYGLIEDYQQLDSMGVSVRGKVAVVRYGRSFRGIKAREAEKHGAVALLIYSDPQDDGYVRGDVYPAGPMRPPQGVQRGSVYNGQGDPSTPNGPSTNGARRTPVSRMDVPRIPVVPIGYANAAE